jgi:hypothetical protein
MEFCCERIDCKCSAGQNRNNRRDDFDMKEYETKITYMLKCLRNPRYARYPYFNERYKLWISQWSPAYRKGSPFYFGEELPDDKYYLMLNHCEKIVSKHAQNL